MADLTIEDVRRKFPQYNDLSDDQLADALHRKYYSDMPREDFNQRIGLAPSGAAAIPENERKYTEQPMGAVERYTRLASSYVPGSERIQAATYAALPPLVADEFQNAPLSERYGRALRYVRRRQDIAQGDGTGVGDLAARTAGLAATTVGTGGYGLFRSLLPEGASLWQLARESARIGAGMGAPFALANTRNTDPVAQTADVTEGAVGGGAFGFALPFALNVPGAAGGLVRRLVGGNRARIANQQLSANDYRELGLEPPPAAIAENPVMQAHAMRTIRGVAGGPLRDDLGNTISNVERGIVDTVGPQNFAEEQQNLLRRNLHDYSINSDDLAGMSRAQLEEIAGFAPHPQTEPPPSEQPAAAGQRPSGPPPVPPRDEELSNLLRNSNSPGANRLREAELQMRHLQERHAQLERDLLDEMKTLGFQAIRSEPRLEGNPQAGYRIVAVRNDGTEIQQTGSRFPERGSPFGFRGDTTPDEREFFRRVIKDWFNGTEIRQKQLDTQKLALQSARNAVRREAFEAMLRRQSGDRAALGAEIRTGSRETYPTQLSAQYRLAEMEPVPGVGAAENIRGNFLSSLDTRNGQVTGPTQTRRLLIELGQQARASGRLRGWKDGDLESEDFWNMLRGRLGEPVTDALHNQYLEAGRPSPVNPKLSGLRDIRTLVRRAAEDAREGGGGISSENVTALERLHGAMTDDLQSIITNAGGTEAAMRYMAADRRYSELINSQRDSLRRIVGKQVSPDDAARRLAEATQTGSYDSRVLSELDRVMREKATPEEAARSVRLLLAPMAEGGLPGFLKAWRNMDPRAREMLMQGPAKDLITRLDRYARVAEKLLPFQKAIQERGMNPGARSNVALGAHVLLNVGGTGFLFGVPSAVFSLGGRYAFAKFMTSPRYLRWLTEVPGRAGSKPELTAHLNRLAAIANADPDIGRTVLSAIGIGNANAGEANGGDGQAAEGGGGGAPFLEAAGKPGDPDPIGQVLGRNQWERFIAPVRGVGHMLGHVAEDVPAATNRLLQYQPGTQDRQAPIDALTLAMTAGLGSAPSAALGGVERGALGTFIGSHGAQNLALHGRPTALKVINTAKVMDARGMPTDDIIQWANRVIEREDPRLGPLDRGADGQWQVELSDHEARYRHPEQPGEYQLGQLLEHPELYNAYPELRDVQTIYEPKLRGANYLPNAGELGMPAEIAMGRVREPVDTLLHEGAGHGVQDIEGFPRGGSPSEFGGRVDPYLAMSGEVAARRITQRRNLTPAERRASPMRNFESEYPDAEQIIRYNPKRQIVQEAPEERLLAVKKLFGQGMTAQQMADHLGVSRPTIHADMRTLGLSGKERIVQRGVARREAIKQAAQERMSARAEARQKFMEQIIAARERGVSMKEIAAQHGRTSQPALIDAFRRAGRGDLIRKQAPKANLADVQQVRQALERGTPIRIIAADMGRHPQTVYQMIREIPELTEAAARGPRRYERPADLESQVRRAEEAHLDRTALSIEREARVLERRLREQNRSPEEIAREMSRRYGGNITAADIASGRVWWRVREGRGRIDATPFDEWMSNRIREE